MFPVPALTAAQVLDEALKVNAGDRLLVNGAGGVTGRLDGCKRPPSVTTRIASVAPPGAAFTAAVTPEPPVIARI